VAGAYQLPVNGSEVLFARIADPWLLRQMPNPAAAAIYSGPGDLGHTYRYYLRRAAMAAGHDTTSVRTANEWAILSGKVAKRITNKAIVTGLMKDATRKRTWKEQFADSY